jgi:VWFA-related protein
MALAALTTVLGQSDAAPAEQASPQSSVPTIKVYTRETLVDVTVTDKDGKPVHGLTRADFSVTEDDKPQSIRSFQEFGSEAVPEPPKLPPNIYINQQPPTASSAVDLLWLDFRNVHGFYAQHLAEKEAQRYLQDMPPGTRVAVLGSYGPSTLRILQGFTSDTALLSATIDTMPSDTTSSPDVGESFTSWCTRWEQLNQATLESLDQIAADMAGIKGRKNLIWFMTGIPAITDPKWRPSCLTDYSTKLKKAYGLLAAAQVTVFPIDARGLPAPPPPPQEVLSMESVAEATGGAAFYWNSDLKAGITKAVESGSDFYTITYVPPGTEYDGRHHTIKLEADQPGLHLTYRDEYYAEDPTKMAPTVGLTLTTTPPDASTGNMKAAMSRSMPTSSALLFYVDVEPSTAPAKPNAPPILGTLDPSFKGKPLTRYAFSYSISAGQLTYTSGPNATHNGSVELDLAAYDADVKLVTGLSQTVTMSLNDTTVANKQPLNFSQQLDLPPGQLFVRIGVLDRTSNKAGTLEIPLLVGKKSATPAAVAPK